MLLSTMEYLKRKMQRQQNVMKYFADCGLMGEGKDGLPALLVVLDQESIHDCL